MTNINLYTPINSFKSNSFGAKTQKFSTSQKIAKTTIREGAKALPGVLISLRDPQLGILLGLTFKVAADVAGACVSKYKKANELTTFISPLNLCNISNKIKKNLNICKPRNVLEKPIAIKNSHLARIHNGITDILYEQIIPFTKKWF